MVIAVFKGSDIARVYDLWQWDYGQKLRIQGLDLPTAVEIHFSLTESSGESITRVGNTVDGVTDVIIPDSMLENETALQSTYNIYAFIYLTDDTSGETVKKIVMEVKTRPKPEAFDAPEDAELFREAIQAVNDAADRAKVSETNAFDSAGSAQLDAAKTTAERLEVERLVQSVSGIEDEVKVVEQYKEQAIQAAQTAGTSEQNAKASETAAQVAQKAAESAKALTKQYKTAAAESANTSVQASANAEESARSAEQSASQTTQIAQAAVQNIEKAGSDQINAVNDAGESQKQEVNAVGASQIEAVTNAGAAQVEEVNSAGEEKVEAIQQKGQQVLDSIPQDYDTAMAGKLDKQQGTENAGKVMTVGEDGSVAPTDAPQGMTTEQKQQLDKATADIKDLYNTKANAIMDTLTGNPVVLKTAKEDLDIDIEMRGWTRQNQYEGKNLLSNNPMDWMMNKNISWGASPGTEIGFNTLNQKYASTIIIRGIKNNTKYSFKNLQKENLWLSRIVQADENGNGYVNIPLYGDVATQNKEEYTFTVSNENVTTFYICVRTLPESESSASADITEDDIRNMQICLSEGDPMYEPYTGNAPSPSPEYPQEIVNAGKYNEKMQKYEVELKLTGKNLFDKEYVKNKNSWTSSSGGYPFIPIYVGKGKKITISTDASLPTGLGFYCTIAKEGRNTSNNVYTWLYHSTSSNLIKTNVTLTVTESDYIYLALNSPEVTLQKFLDNFTNFQIEYGESRTEYQEYKEQIVRVISDRPITQWDRLVEKDGQIGWEYNSKIENNPSITQKLADDSLSNGTYNRYDTNMQSVYPINEDKCNILINDSKNDKFFSIVASGKIILYFHQDLGINTIELAKEWLDNVKTTIGIEFVYRSKSTQFVSIPSEEQEALRELKTYFPISVISNDQDCQMDITYAMDTKAYIDKKFGEIQSALVTTNSILLGGE